MALAYVSNLLELRGSKRLHTVSSLNIEIKPNTSKNKYWQCEKTLNNDNNNNKNCNNN